MTSLQRAANCVTHHHGCDCREYRHMQIEGTLEQIQDLADCNSEIESAKDDLLGQIWLLAYNALNRNSNGE